MADVTARSLQYEYKAVSSFTIKYGFLEIKNARYMRIIALNSFTILS